MSLNYEAWLEVASRFNGPSATQPLIVESWRRSEAAGLAREHPPSFHCVSDADLRRRQARRGDVIRLAIPHLKWLVSWFHGRPSVAYVTDEDGIVLHAEGAPEVIAKFNLAPGFDWSEGRMGTNGAGTAIAAGCPVAVIACDHWSVAWENATCLGAPILDGDGNIVGAIDLSADAQPGDADRLVVAAHAAYTITSELARREAETRAAVSDTRYQATRAALEESRLSRELLQTIIDSTAAVVYVVDSQQRFRLINREFGRLFGIDPQAALGQSVYDFFPRTVADQFVAHNRQVLEECRMLEFEEVVLLEGVARTYLTVKAPLYDAAGVPYAICGVSTDMTTQMQMLDALRQASQQKDAFLATVAHELRQPLGAIQAALGVMRLRGSRDAGERARQTAERQVAQLARLVGDLGDASRVVRRQVTIERQPTRLNDVIELAVNVVERTVAEHEQDLQVTTPAEPVWVDADPTRLQQVFSNLLTNAVKFTPDRGVIAVVVEREPAGVAIRVRDTGRGIPPEVLPHIFDLFAQEKPEGGLGIGLAVVRALVEGHGGTVEARSAGAGCGSEFIVRLPVLSERRDT